MFCSYQFRCRPTRAQAVALDSMVFSMRAVYNAALEQRRSFYQRAMTWGHEKRSLSFYDQDAEIKHIRAEFPECKAIPFAVLRGAVRGVDLAMQAFFRRIKAGETPGFPRFKSSFRDRQTLQLGEFRRWHKDKGKIAHINVKGIPGKLRFKIHNPAFAADDVTVKTTKLTRDHKGWLVTFQCELPDVPAALVADRDFIAIDLGIEKFCVTDDGGQIDNPRLLDKKLRCLRRYQRALARKQRGSGGRGRARKRVARFHAKVANTRKTFHREVAARLVEKGKHIAAEDLNIKGLSGGMLARQVADAGWGDFLNKLENKAESAGLRVERVDPKFTSQACSGCGSVVRKSLATRIHRCVSCGLVLDRDHNAAINIKNKAVAGLGGHNAGVARRGHGNFTFESQQVLIPLEFQLEIR